MLPAWPVSPKIRCHGILTTVDIFPNRRGTISRRRLICCKWKEYKPARDEQFRIKEDKARRESALNTQFAKKLREEFDAKQ